MRIGDGMAARAWMAVACLALQACASGGGQESGTRRASEMAPQVSGLTFEFEGDVFRQTDTRHYEGVVRFLDDRFSIMEVDDRPCDTRPVPYQVKADEVEVSCLEAGLQLVLYMTEGRILGRLTAPVPVTVSRRVCDIRSTVAGRTTCTKYGEVREERMMSGRGEAVVRRVSN